MRLNKYLSACGAAPSRRKGDDLIASGAVSINGRIVTELGTIVDPLKDDVRAHGNQCSLPDDVVLIALHKPAGYVTTKDDPNAEKTVYDLLPDDLRNRVHSVGRLDKDTSGLLLFTNDGDLTHRLTHPSFEHEKEYVLVIEGALSDEAMHKMKTGVRLEDGTTAPAEISGIEKRSGSATEFRMTIHEGRNRQIRRMCEALGLNLRSLHRLRMERHALGNLPEGHWRNEPISD